MELQAKKGYQIGIKWLAFSSLITAVGFGGYFVYNYYENKPLEPLKIRLATLKKDTIKISFNEPGTVKLGNQQVVKTPAEGAVETVFVAVGDRIFVGDELARLRNHERETKIIEHQLETRVKELELKSKQRALANAERAVAEKRIVVGENIEKIEEIKAKLKEPHKQKELRDLDFNLRKHKLNLEESRQAVINAELELEEAQQKIEVEKKLLDKGLISNEDFLNKEKGLREQRSNLRSAEKTLEEGKIQLEQYQLQYQDIQLEITKEIENIQSELRKAESELRRAESEFQNAKEDLIEKKDDLIKHNIELQKEELAYQEFIQEIENSTIISPINGKVLSIHAKPGDGLEIGKPLLTVANPNIELVELNLSTLNAAKVEPNQLALVTVIGPETEPLRGRVENISLTAGDGSGESSSSSSGAARVGATVRLDNPAGLIPGTTVNVEIILEQAEDVPALEVDLVRRENDRDFVWVQDSEGKARKQTVTIGLEDGIKVEITSGLKLEDKAIVPPLDETLEPGRAIAVIESEKSEN